jgi:hypothetical protein
MASHNGDTSDPTPRFQSSEACVDLTRKSLHHQAFMEIGMVRGSRDDVLYPRTRKPIAASIATTG